MTSPAAPVTGPQLRILAGLRQLCRLFWGPDADQCREILAGSFFEPFTLSDSQWGPGTLTALQTIHWYLRTLPDATALCEALETNYIRLFISGKGGIGVPIYQSCHDFEGAPLMGPSAVRMRCRLEAIGLSLTGNAAFEPPDHLAVELEYLYFLLEKGNREQDRSLIAEAAAFAKAEMLQWIGAFERRLHQAPDSVFYASAASLAGILIRRIAHDTTIDGGVSHTFPELSR